MVDDGEGFGQAQDRVEADGHPRGMAGVDGQGEVQRRGAGAGGEGADQTRDG